MNNYQEPQIESQPTRAVRTRRFLPLCWRTALALLGSACLLGAQPAEVFVNPALPPGPATFPTIQAAIDAVAPHGVVHVASGAYVEDLTVSKPLSLLGPNAGKAGDDPSRTAEAILLPLTDDSANGQIVYLSASDVVIDGFLFDGDNPNLHDGYPVGTGTAAAEANTSAAIQNTFFWTTDFAQIEHIRIQNNIIRNVSYDGIYLELALGTDNGFNYILNNKFETMWEGLQTYAVHSVISNNVFLGVNRGLSLHGTVNAAPAGFAPLIASNVFTIGEWWPAEIARVRTEGIWLNYRRDNAAPILVSGNTVNTPATASPPKTVRGFYALNLDGKGKVTFLNNSLNGYSNCMQGLTVAMSANAGAVTVMGGSLAGVSQAGIFVTSKDADWGAGDARVTVSNVVISMTGGWGILVNHDAATTNDQAQARVLGDCHISGAAVAVQVMGTNASAILLDNASSMVGNLVGIYVDQGKALVQGNNLSGNTEAGIRVVNDGVVDAGDCTSANITGLGSSSGGNKLLGYGLDGSRWAIDNRGTVPVRAQNNDFGAASGDDIAKALSGPIEFSQTPLLAAAPGDVTVQCVGEIPLPAQDYATFRALGGVASASTFTSVTYDDTPINPLVGNQDVTRTWTLVDTCGNSVKCEQAIHVLDSTAPILVAPDPVTTDADPGQCVASAEGVNLGTPIVSDNCGLAYVTSNPPAIFPTGPTVVTWTAVDINGLVSTAIQVVTVRDLPPVLTQVPQNIVQAVDPGQNYATVLFNVAATDCSELSLAVNPPSGSHFPVGTNTVTVTASDFAGNVSNASFTVAVIGLPTITTQPQPLNVAAGSNATFTVVADSLAPMTYQWYRSGAPVADGGRVSGATTASLTFTGATGTDSGTLVARISNLAGSVDSAPAAFVVLDPARVQLTSYSRLTGAAILAISGTTGLNYQLQCSTDLVNWTSLITNSAPYSYTDPSGGALRFYRTVYTP